MTKHFYFVERMKIAKVKKAMTGKKYILFRTFPDSICIGVNCKIGLRYIEESKVKEDYPTNIISFRECNFSEYLRFKIPHIWLKYKENTEPKNY